MKKQAPAKRRALKLCLSNLLFNLPDGLFTRYRLLTIQPLCFSNHQLLFKVGNSLIFFIYSLTPHLRYN